MAIHPKTYARTIFTDSDKISYKTLLNTGKATEGDVILDRKASEGGILYTHNTSFYFMDPSLYYWYDEMRNHMYTIEEEYVKYEDKEHTTVKLDNVIFKTLQIGHPNAGDNGIDTILSFGFDDNGHKYDASFWDDVNVHIELLWVKPKDIGENTYEAINVYNEIIGLQSGTTDIKNDINVHIVDSSLKFTDLYNLASDISTRLSEIKIVYDTELPEELTTINALGGISANTSVAALKGKTLTSIIDDLLFPTILPTITGPSITFTLANTVSEVGTTAPAKNSFTINANRGSAKIGSKSVNYTGTVDSSVIYYGGNKSNTTLPTLVTHGTTKYTYSVTFNAGEILKDSKGNNANAILNNNYKNPYPGGTLTKDINVIGRYPLYANTSNITAVTKQTVSNSSPITLVLPDETDANKHIIKVPATYTITDLELLNTLSGNFEKYDINTKFVKTSENIDVNTNATNIPYNVYTRNDGKNGAATFKLYLTY